MSGKSKGADHERWICRLLSRWWSESQGDVPIREDIFWRTPGSGARATVREKTASKVQVGHGDIQAEDLVGQPLVNMCTFELKTGYPDISLFSCIDSTQKIPRIYQFLQEAEDEAKPVGNHPVLIMRRERKAPIIALPDRLTLDMESYYGNIDGLTIRLRTPHTFNFRYYILMNLDIFFEWADHTYFVLSP